MKLPHDLQEFVDYQLKSANYESFDELVIDAIALLREQYPDWLFEQIDIGRRQIENGECIELRTPAEIDEFFEGIKRGRPGLPAC